VEGARPAGDHALIDGRRIMTETAGEQFVRAFTARDRIGLSVLLADSIDFRGLTPGRYWEGTTSREVVDEILLGHWLDDTDHVTELISVATGRVADREHVAYRFRVESAGVSYIAEQQAYYMLSGGKIDWLRMLCSGTRLDPEAASPDAASGSGGSSVASSSSADPAD
jgi:hypothetical protein